MGNKVIHHWGTLEIGDYLADTISASTRAIESVYEELNASNRAIEEIYRHFYGYDEVVEDDATTAIEPLAPASITTSAPSVPSIAPPELATVQAAPPATDATAKAHANVTSVAVAAVTKPKGGRPAGKAKHTTNKRFAVACGVCERTVESWNSKLRAMRQKAKLKGQSEAQIANARIAVKRDDCTFWYYGLDQPFDAGTKSPAAFAKAFNPQRWRDDAPIIVAEYLMDKDPPKNRKTATATFK